MDKNKRETSLETALMLAPQLQQYIHNIDKIPELSQNTQEKVLEWVQQARRKNMLVMTMGILIITSQERRISTEVIYEFMKLGLWEADGITDSDHVILKTS
ncbi:42277_t:CDS:2 [Gigaspora margarita]|uniref:42277_t:CDS:1 n=1 Tax=Gigaspora margarita TaxID=4874 RepID=A0ABN7V7T3_GIGMA|nr:42277_t:CDS:2 [Gigaspora margarita]